MLRKSKVYLDNKEKILKQYKKMFSTSIYWFCSQIYNYFVYYTTTITRYQLYLQYKNGRKVIYTIITIFKLGIELEVRELVNCLGFLCIVRRRKCLSLHRLGFVPRLFWSIRAWVVLLAYAILEDGIRWRPQRRSLRLVGRQERCRRIGLGLFHRHLK